MKSGSKIIVDPKDLRDKIVAHRILEHKIVCTIGSWDLLHIGHVRYLNYAKAQGDILIVGVDSDRAIKSYKNPLRPIIPESERMEMLSYQNCVDFVTLVDDVNNKGEWQFTLLKEILMDFFVIDGESYTSQQKSQIAKYCGKTIVVPRQAQSTSTSNIIQNILKKHLIKKVGELKRKK